MFQRIPASLWQVLTTLSHSADLFLSSTSSKELSFAVAVSKYNKCPNLIDLNKSRHVMMKEEGVSPGKQQLEILAVGDDDDDDDDVS